MPDSVIGFLGGELGDPPGGWPEPFRTRALRGRAPPRHVQPRSPTRTARISTPTPPHAGTGSTTCCSPAPPRTSSRCGPPTGTSACWTPHVPVRDDAPRDEVTPLDKGVRLLLGLEAVGEPDARGMRSVMFTLNGQLRPIQVRDRSVEVDAAAAEKADPGTPGQIAAPFAGAVTPVVQEGQKVRAGQTVATIEAMKMEAASRRRWPARCAASPSGPSSSSRAATWCWSSTDPCGRGPGPGDWAHGAEQVGSLVRPAGRPRRHRGDRPGRLERRGRGPGRRRPRARPPRAR